MPTKGERTRDALLDTALRLFRRRGFDGTTMRDIAGAAEMSLGASYHYFRSKEEIVAAYYERVQLEHERALPATWPDDTPLAERLRVAFRTKLAIVAGDRRFLGALFRYAGEPEHPLGLFSNATRDVRARAVALFSRAVDGAVDPALAPRVAEAAWLAHLGLLLHLLHDTSKDAARTAALADAIADTIAQLVQLAALPPARAIIDHVWDRVATALGRRTEPGPADHRGPPKRRARAR